VKGKSIKVMGHRENSNANRQQTVVRELRARGKRKQTEIPLAGACRFIQSNVTINKFKAIRLDGKSLRIKMFRAGS